MGTGGSRGPDVEGLTLAVVGVTGAVGRVVLDVLPMRGPHWARVRLAAGHEDVGSVCRVNGEDVVVEALTPDFFDGVDVAIFDIAAGDAAAHQIELWNRTQALNAIRAGQVPTAALNTHRMTLAEVPGRFVGAIESLVEFIHERIGARTLFATHYHELTDLSRERPAVPDSVARGTLRAGFSIRPEAAHAASNPTIAQRVMAAA